MFRFPLLVLAICLAGLMAEAQQTGPWILSAPAGNLPTQVVRDGRSVIPNGRFADPIGKRITVAPHPYGLALSRDGSIAVTSNCGIRPISVSIIDNILGETPTVRQIPEGAQTDRGVLEAAYMGLAISPDNKTLYVAGGQEGKVFLYDINTRARTGEIHCNTTLDRAYTNTYIGDMALTRDGKTLYAVDQLNFRMLIIDTEKKKLAQSVPVGRYPFGIALSPDEKHVYVANVGMYEYKIAYTFKPNDPKEKRIHRDLFAYLSPESAAGATVDGVQVPGLGDPLSPESFSVFTIDVSSPQPKVVAKVKTGIQIGELVEGVPAVGGSSPNSVVATEDHVFVSNGNNDCITVIDARTHTVQRQLFLSPDARLKNLRGMIPFGLALSPDNKRLFVAEAGINAVGVIDIPTMKVLGHIPAGWFPSKVQVSPDGKKLLIANAKGLGSGPNGGPNFQMGPEGSYIGNLMKGLVNVMEVPKDSELGALTQKVLDNNFLFRKAEDPAFSYRANNPIPLFPGEKESPIKHVVFILKENRTYDEIFGQLPGGNGAPQMARFGANVSVKRLAGDTIKGLDIMPNHLALAKAFGMADNFYVDSDVSADGHKWLVGVYPNEWVEVNVVNSYGGVRGFRPDTLPPGMELMLNGYVSPEDYNEAGSVWFHLDRLHVPFFNFGLDTYILPREAAPAFAPQAERNVTNRPAPKGLIANTSEKYPSYNTSIPDQFRADVFMEEFQEKWGAGKMPMPAYTTIRLGNDHGAGVRVNEGYPYFQSYMSDNDLALGRIIEFLTHTPYWKNMLIVVTEDDAQGGVDHVDAHRSVLLAVSPYVRRGHVSHEHLSFGSIMKTFWNCLNVPYLNQYDAGAQDMADFFTNTPDFTPYKALPVDPEIFDPSRALDPYDREFNWASLKESPEMDNMGVMQDQSHAADQERAGYQPLIPEIIAAGSHFVGKTTVTLKARIYNAAIRYTLDGSEPTLASPLYSKPLELSETVTLKAKAFNPNGLSSRAVSSVFTREEPLPAMKAKAKKPGLPYRYFEGTWEKLPDFAQLTPLKTGTVNQINVQGLNRRDDHWGLQFAGYFHAPADGIYTFRLESDDGAILYIDGKALINNDGSHSARTREAFVPLKKGKHALRLDYFQDTEEFTLSLQVQKPGMRMEPIPVSALWHE